MGDREYIPDIHERGEDRCERIADEMYIDAQHRKCPGCGQVYKNSELCAMSPDPYATPYCRACVDDFMSSKEVSDA